MTINSLKPRKDGKWNVQFGYSNGVIISKILSKDAINYMIKGENEIRAKENKTLIKTII